MIILGIDPGTRVTGYGIIDAGCNVLDAGCVRIRQQETLPNCYCTIFDAMHYLIDRFSPTHLAIETQYVAKNAQSAIKLGMARGVCIVAAAKRGLSIHEYSPTRAKAAICHGRASKQQMQQMIKVLLGLKNPLPPDASDALALAICHLHTVRNHV